MNASRRDIATAEAQAWNDTDIIEASLVDIAAWVKAVRAELELIWSTGPQTGRELRFLDDLAHRLPNAVAALEKLPKHVEDVS